jgi:hypothetical protein
MTRNSYKGKKAIIVFILNTFLCFVCQRSVFAQKVPTNEVLAQNWRCLNAEKVARHTVHITAEDNNLFLPPSSDVYIVECISTDTQGGVCSSGVPEIDNFLGFSGPPPGFTITHSIAQPVKSDINGRLVEEPFIWRSDGPRSHHTFRGIILIPFEISAAEGASFKLGSFFPDSGYSNCQSIRWAVKDRFEAQEMKIDEEKKGLYLFIIGMCGRCNIFLEKAIYF